MPSPEREPLYGWLMVVVTFVFGCLSFGGLGTIAVVLKPLTAEFGWTRGEVSFGYTTLAFSSIVAVLWGVLADRHGARPLAFLGAFGMAGALYLMSRQETLWQFYLFYFLFGAMGHSAVSSPLYTAAGFWFSRHKGLAIGVMSAGGAAGQAVMPYLAQTLITDHGWRAAYAVLAIGYLAIALPLAALVREAPVRQRAAREGARAPAEKPFPLSPREALTWICIAVIFCCTCMSVPIVHLVPLISDRGIDPRTAAIVLGVLMTFGILGRIMGGVLADYITPLGSYAVTSLGQTMLVLWFPWIDGLGGLYLLAAAFGLFFSGVMTAILVCVREIVPAHINARAMATIIFFAWIGMGTGSFQGGLFFDLTGDYHWSYTNAAIAGVVNLAIQVLFFLRIRSRRHAAALAE